MPDVAIATVDIFFALLHGNVVCLRVGDGVFAECNVVLAPGSNDLQIGRDGFVGQFETVLVVAFAGATVGKTVGAELERDFGLPLAEDGAGHGGPEQIGVFVDGAGAQRRPDVIAHKFFAQILDVGGGGAGGQRFFSRGFEIFLLADVADHGDDFALIIFLEPVNYDGGVEPARILYDYFLGLVRLYFHNSSLRSNDCQAGAQQCCAPTRFNPIDGGTGIRWSEQRVQDGFLHAPAIFGLVEGGRARAIASFRGHLQAAARR